MWLSKLELSMKSIVLYVAGLELDIEVIHLCSEGKRLVQNLILEVPPIFICQRDN